MFDKKGTKAGKWETNFGETAIRLFQLAQFVGLHKAQNPNWEKQTDSISKQWKNPLKF
jgi:hypothetical protein